MRSPMRTAVAALAVTPLIETRPLRQASVADERVLKMRTAHSHWSTLGDALHGQGTGGSVIDMRAVNWSSGMVINRS